MKLVVERDKVGKEYGVVLVGFAENLRALRDELNETMAHKEGNILSSANAT